METIINVDDVSFSYGTQTEQALAKHLARREQGRFIGIIGPSGAGKSTLAACLSGAVPHHYTGTFFGWPSCRTATTPAKFRSPMCRRSSAVCCRISTRKWLLGRRGRDAFGLENFGVPHDQIEQRVSETLETVGISDLRDREIATAFGRPKQRLPSPPSSPCVRASRTRRPLRRSTRQLHAGLRDPA
ncbi:MAG: ATP-binding cassette domain-containing protein [Collinsella sp.]